LNGQTIHGIDELQRFLAEWPLQRAITLTILRGREKLDVGVTPVEAN